MAAFTGVPGYERDHAGNPMCGHDFMAGTICSDVRGHEGGHSCRCQVCGGDWMNETCTCASPTGDCFYCIDGYCPGDCNETDLYEEPATETVKAASR